MEYIDQQRVTEDLKKVENSFSLMKKIAEMVTQDGISISIEYLVDIGMGRKSLTSLFTKEAEQRHSKSPTYVRDEAVTSAKARANTYQAVVNSLRDCYLFVPEKFKIDKEFNVSYAGDLEKELIKSHTRILTPSQEKIVNQVKEFLNSLIQINILFKKIGEQEILIKNIPLIDPFGEPDLRQISLIDLNDLESKENERMRKQIEEGNRVKEENDKRLKEILSLIPNSVPNRQSEAEHLLQTELMAQIKHDDTWIRKQFKNYV
jgi:hypothetical protein